ncbi:MAG: DUF4872 domain-containing protein [Anaerolineae bacterium]|nr:DUF4872 domain-containing protein [Anaerolineae bacterium]
MPQLDNYRQFDGLAWATGYLRNALAYQGVTAPHTDEPYSEALLMGISGGIAAGYFAFEYEGYDPHLHFLTRYPFNEEPVAAFERLAIPTEPRTTRDAQKAVANVIDALVAGKPVVVWLDVLSLLEDKPQDAWWMINPVLVYGYDMQQGSVHIADRARVPIVVEAERFAAARARLSKTRHRTMTLGAPDPDRLPNEVETGIRACIDIFTGKPPVGAASSWGFAAYDKWIDLLTKSKHKQSWGKMFAPCPRMYAGLTSTYKYLEVFYTGGAGARGLYADFLEEAAAILGKPALRAVAGQFRACAERWTAFTRDVLPDAIPLLKEARDLLTREYTLYLERGIATDGEQAQIIGRLAALRQAMDSDFPLDEAGATAMRERLAEHLVGIRTAEQAAFVDLKAAL